MIFYNRRQNYICAAGCLLTGITIHLQDAAEALQDIIGIFTATP